MTSQALAKAFPDLLVPTRADMPVEAVVLAPPSAEGAARVLDAASEHRVPVTMWGSGTHQGYGYPVGAKIVLSTERMTTVVEWSPADLTVIVEAGVPVAELATTLAQRGQTAVLPEGSGTVGGAVAAGLSGWARLRYGPIRDRTLEVVLATGDGRLVRGGAPVVKNVTGYDLPRLAAGSFGSLGLICRIALKLWPIGAYAATVSVPDAEEALGTAYAPQAVIEEDGVARVYLAGTEDEVKAQTAQLGGTAAEGLDWPRPLAGDSLLVIRVPAAHTRAAVDRVPPGWTYQASFGVGEVRLGGPADEAVPTLTSLRAWAEELDGSVVVERAPAELYRSVDPWGDPGPSLTLQRRVKAAFDPLGVCNAGRLPGQL
jgi:glycolate oxidase FAD binding subunit